MFNNANLMITGGNYTQVVGTGQEFETLHRHIASGALHDSGERFNPPRCHPETRGVLLSEIMEWITKTNRDTLILWLYGSVGSGKSALAQSVAEQCQDLGLLAATFFFSRLSPERCHEKHLSSTISYQLALSIPETRSHIEHIVQHDPSIFGRAFQTQYQRLVVSPLRLAKNQTQQQSRPQLVIIDGLDECQDPKAQRYILDVVNQEFQRCTHLPLLFLITSRPEEQIRMAFGSGNLERISRQISLQDYFGSHDDVRNFIRNRFEEIKLGHPLRDHISPNWPTPEVIETLVRKSSGQFAYASTVVEFVSSIYHRPTDRLDVILGLSPHIGDSPFSELDSLYKHVFSSAPHKDNALRIMSAVLLMDLEMSPELVERLLVLKPGDVHLHLSGLASVVSFRERQKAIKVLHTSLGDFLLDSSRSAEFHIEAGKAHAELATVCLHHLERLEVPVLIDYACYNLETHLDLATGTQELHDAILRFQLSKFVAYSGKPPSQQQNEILATTLEDVWYFVPSFFDCIQNSIIFEDADAIYEHHSKQFDQYLEDEFDKYVGDSRLTDMVTMLTICHSPITVKKLEDVSYFKDAVLQLDGSAEHLVLIDENSLNLRHMVRRHGQAEPYIELLCQFLEDAGRSGRHFIDGQKYALAALRCSRRIGKPTRTSHDEHGAGSFIWSLECTPPLLLHASHYDELSSYLEGALLGTVIPQTRYSFYPGLARMVKEARIAYLISSTLERRTSDTCNRHTAQLDLVPQGLRISRSEPSSAERSKRAVINLKGFLFDGIPRVDPGICCCSYIVAEYYNHSHIPDLHREFSMSRGQSSVIVHVEDPFPEINSSFGLESATADATGSGVMKILTYRVWKSLVQNLAL